MVKSLSWMAVGLLTACGSAPIAPVEPSVGVPPAAGKPSAHPQLGGPQVSGAAIQDPTGFPPFHDWPAPSGPPVDGVGAWSKSVRLTAKPGGGYRPQVAIGADGQVHALFYERTDVGDLIRHRMSRDGLKWSAPKPLGHANNRNWGPDVVAQSDGSLAVVYDHALPDFRSRGYFTRWSQGGWSSPVALTPDDGGEVGSGHIAHGRGDSLAYVFIAKRLDPTDHFAAHYRWFRDGEWGEVGDFTDGTVDAWHTNVERRPDGSMLAGWDVGNGGAETTLFVVEGRDGAWGTPEDISAGAKPGERVHFAFGPGGVDHLTWFHKVGGRPRHVYVRSGRPGAWGPVQEPSRGFGGYHFDPDIAVNAQGISVLVWGWDGGAQAELVYSVDRGQGWSPPKIVARLGHGKPGLPSIDVDGDGRFYVVWNQGVRGTNEVYTASLEVR